MSASRISHPRRLVLIALAGAALVVVTIGLGSGAQVARADAVYNVGWSGANVLPTAATPGQTLAVSVTFTNNGSLSWTSSAVNGVYFAYHWRTGNCAGAYAIFDGLRTALPGTITTGQTVTSLAAN